MYVKIDNREIAIPTSLKQITLKQRIDFQFLYGIELDETLQKISEMKDSEEKQLELMDYQIDVALKSFSFFSEIPLEELQEFAPIEKILHIYNTSLSILLEQEDAINDEVNIEEPIQINWNDENWKIESPILTSFSEIKFGEWLTAKETVRQCVKVGNGYMPALLPLCILFFRKENEPFQESFMKEGSERYKLMESLPMDIALKVGFFLSKSIKAFMSSFQYLESRN